MPSTILLRQSLLHFESAANGRNVVIWGVDRFGHLKPSSAILTDANAQPACFLGTASSFGIFSAETRVLLANGTSKTVAQLIEEESIYDENFEHAFPSSSVIRISFNDIWTRLLSLAATSDNDFLTLRKRGHLLAGVSDWIRDYTSGNTSFIRLNRSNAQRAFERDPLRCIIMLCNAWCFVDNAVGFQMERDFADLFYFLSRHILEGAGCYTYESAQHTNLLQLGRQRSAAGMAIGKVAFRTRRLEVAEQLTWSDTTWHPISAGFLLAGAN